MSSYRICSQLYYSHSYCSHTETTMAKKTKFSLIKETPDCISAIRTLFVVSKLFGCNLFYLPKDRYSVEPIRMRFIDYVTTLLYVVLYSVITVPFFIEMVFEKTSILLPSGNIVIICLVRCIFYFIIIANFSCYIMDALNKNKIWRLLTQLYDFDEEVSYVKLCPSDWKFFILNLFSGKEFGHQSWK